MKIHLIRAGFVASALSIFLGVAAVSGEETAPAPAPNPAPNPVTAPDAGAGDKKLPEKTPRQKVLEDCTDKEMLSHWDIAAGVENLVTLPTGSGNAADHYAKLESLYPKERKETDNPKNYHVRPDGQGVQEILQGAKIKDSWLNPKYYPHMESGTSEQPESLIFLAYRDALLEYADGLEKQGKDKEALEAYQAGLIWGWHLLNERPNLITLELGALIEYKCAKQYALCLQRNMDIHKARVADDYADKTKEWLRRISVKSQAYLGDFRNFNCLYSTIRIAKYDQDYLWRQVAVLRLAVLRHGAPDEQLKAIIKDEAQQNLAKETLQYVANNDPAKWVRTLALWAIQTVTAEKVREMQFTTIFRGFSMIDNPDDDAKKDQDDKPAGGGAGKP